ILWAVCARRADGGRDRGGEAQGPGRAARPDAFPRARAETLMRVIAGRFKGRTLDAPKGLTTRPTSDRVREALFNVLEHGAPDVAFEGARVLDLFAGSGALGLEALSRGARYSLFIEDD